MPPKENKTADKKAYQAQYRKDHPKSKEDQKKYMKKYISEAVSVECPVCKAAGFSGSFMSYNKYKHDATQKHKEAENILKAKHELKKREEEEEAAQKAALEKASAKPKRKIKIGKKKVEEKKEEPKKEEPKVEEKPKSKPKPKIKISKKKEEENIKMEIKEKPKEKHASLKDLEEYASSSDEEKEEEEKLEDTVFCFQPKEIDSKAVAEFIQEHHEKSANPARSADSKTVRLNKNASLWRKVAKELDGKKFSYLGGHFGEIVTKAYDKPSSQADFVQMLKMVVMHFTKVPAGEEKALNMLARKLKTTHVANQK
jgi:hypothetical protein